jgi:hypothetical protein
MVDCIREERTQECAEECSRLMEKKLMTDEDFTVWLKRFDSTLHIVKQPLNRGYFPTAWSVRTGRDPRFEEEEALA